MASRSRGNGTNFDWLRKSCDISTCDLSPDGNPEKYRRPMKSAIENWIQGISIFTTSIAVIENWFQVISLAQLLFLLQFSATASIQVERIKIGSQVLDLG